MQYLGGKSRISRRISEVIQYEPKDVIRGWGLNFNLGSAVKYIARAGRKDDIIQDLEKAKKFLEFEIEALKLDRENGSDV